MNPLDLGDPATQAGKAFTLLMPDPRGGTVVILNESAYGLDFTIGVSTFRVPADSLRTIKVMGKISSQVNWQIANNTNAAIAPISDVVVECYGLDECPSTEVTPLVRQTNIGNTQPVSTNVSQVLNDGNTAPTLVVEGTPSGAASSQLKWNNDGSGLFGGGNASVDNTGKFTLPASAVPVASIASGALPAGVSVPAAQVGSGYPASSLGSGAVPAGVSVPPARLANGTLPAGVAVPGSNVSGAVASATSASSAGSLSGSIGANQVNAGNFPSGQFGMTKLAFFGGGGVSGIAQITGSGSATVNTGISGLQAVVVNTFNGSNSTTYGSGSYTSSTCFIYQFNAQPWVAIVFNN